MLFAIVSVPYIWVETNTYLFSDEFVNCNEQISELKGKEYISKVYYKTIRKAKVLHISYDGTFMSYYKKENKPDWVLDAYDIVWSRFGNASELFYPFYRTHNWSEDI